MLLRRVVGVCDSCVFVGGWSVFISVVCGWFVFAWRERMVIVWIGRLRSRPRAAHPKVEVLRSRPEAVHPKVEHSRSNDRAARARARGRGARAGRRAVGRRAVWLGDLRVRCGSWVARVELLGVRQPRVWACAVPVRSCMAARAVAGGALFRARVVHLSRVASVRVRLAGRACGLRREGRGRGGRRSRHLPVGEKKIKK